MKRLYGLISIIFVFVLVYADGYRLEIIEPPTLGSIVVNDHDMTYTHDGSIDITNFVLDSFTYRAIDDAGNTSGDSNIYVLIIPEFKYVTYFIPAINSNFASKYNINTYNASGNQIALVIKFETNIDVVYSRASAVIRDAVGNKINNVDFKFVNISAGGTMTSYAVALYDNTNYNGREISSGAYLVSVNAEIYIDNRYGMDYDDLKYEESITIMISNKHH